MVATHTLYKIYPTISTFIHMNVGKYRLVALMRIVMRTASSPFGVFQENDQRAPTRFRICEYTYLWILNFGAIWILYMKICISSFSAMLRKMFQSWKLFEFHSKINTSKRSIFLGLLRSVPSSLYSTVIVQGLFFSVY